MLVRVLIQIDKRTIYEYSQKQTACWPVARVNKLNKPDDSKEGDSEETRHLLLAARENTKKKMIIHT